MKTLQIFDPPMCCSTGVCGNDIDPALVHFAALLTQLSRKGVQVERYNLGHQPMAFVQHPVVKASLDAEGVAVLPLIFLDGAVFLKGRYPSDSECAKLLSAAPGVNAEVRS